MSRLIVNEKGETIMGKWEAINLIEQFIDYMDSRDELEDFLMDTGRYNLSKEFIEYFELDPEKYEDYIEQ